MMTIEHFKEARNVLRGVLNETRLIHSPFLSQSCGNQVYLKPENMQVTGAYKIRGAYYKISTMSEEEKSRGLVTASAGNHAQGVAYAARAAGVPATIVMPTTTPLMKVNNTKDYGAQVILHGDVFDEAAALAAKMSEEQGLTYVHPFNDLEVATGQGTIAYEIFQDLPDVDVILVPIGGGGLAAGVSTLAKLLNPNVQVIGVEPVGAASMKASLDAGHVVTLPAATTIADGVAVKTPGDKVFPYVQKNLDEIITISDDELVAAFLDVMEKHKMIAENAGLVTVAALRHLQCRDQNVVSILSGGNMDVITMASVVQNGLIRRGRIFTFSVHLPDRPGELLRVAQILAEHAGNVIKLEHNQFVNVNRASSVELRVTLEAFGHDHKQEILEALHQDGYDAAETGTSKIYD
ncbi:MAG: threonine ammonia-lyase [Oscillospiraceae bacterium]|jgi:threonine dehydratase|nr:threonine ammonia-lyase [Oscillospiraceae bacterium]MCI9394932.1 threonine ammonia-lyase [Oscillospiraceae bacterium]MCI9580218.1 threonine ammonia-lyase [Oscillospiraceae bacterium]